MAALTRGRAGREMVEIGFLMDAGAVAFTDGTHVTRSTRVLARCLTYARSLGALIVGIRRTRPVRRRRRHLGQVRLAARAARVPAMAERMGVERDLGWSR
jgi:dihydroorotase